MEPTPITSALLPSGTDPSTTLAVPRTERRRIGLSPSIRTEGRTGFFQAAVVLQELRELLLHDSSHYALKDSWRTSDKVQRAFDIAATALGELQSRQLYRSTHRCFDHYYRQRFGCFIEDYSPISDSDITRPSISGQ